MIGFITPGSVPPLRHFQTILAQEALRPGGHAVSPALHAILAGADPGQHDRLAPGSYGN